MVKPAGKLVIRAEYDKAFEHQAGERHSWPGDAHDKGLRAVYNKGFADGVQTERKNQERR